jgi:plasmid stabilization system protein ParE
MDNNDEIKAKPAKITTECVKMLKEAIAYIANDSIKQAGIMNARFRQIAKILEMLPGIGTLCPGGLRRIKLDKFRYNIYYRELADIIVLVGIWHTSRGTDFIEPAETEVIDLSLTTDFGNY